MVKVHGLRDFILPTFDNEDEHEALPINTRIKNSTDLPQSLQKQKSSSYIAKDKVINKKNYSPQSNPTSATLPSASKTLVVSDTIEYNIVEDMNNIKTNISLHELRKLKQQQNILLKELNAVPATPLPTPITLKAAKGIGKPPNDSPKKIDASDAILIGDRSN